MLDFGKVFKLEINQEVKPNVKCFITKLILYEQN